MHGDCPLDKLLGEKASFHRSGDFQIRALLSAPLALKSYEFIASAVASENTVYADIQTGYLLVNLHSKKKISMENTSPSLLE